MQLKCEFSSKRLPKVNCLPRSLAFLPNRPYHLLVGRGNNMDFIHKYAYGLIGLLSCISCTHLVCTTTGFTQVSLLKSIIAKAVPFIAKLFYKAKMSDLSTNDALFSNRLPFTLITADVAEATSACLLAQAEEAERLKMPPVVQERMVIEEFGRCLMQIIESANKTRGDQT